MVEAEAEANVRGVGRKAAAGGSLRFFPLQIPVLPRPRTVVSSYAVVG
jgi:hypothetical protein